MSTKYAGQVALNKLMQLVKNAIPTKVSQLTNDAGFITDADIPEGAAASTTAPLMDGTAAVGTSNAFARGDHVHPSDDSKLSLSGGTMTGELDMGQNSISQIRDVDAERVDSQSVYTSYVKFSEQGGGVSLAATPELSPNLRLAKLNIAGEDTGNPVVVKRVGTPTEDTDAANKRYVDGKVVGLQTAAQVQSAIASAISGVYTPKGTVAFASLPTASAANLGWVYNISDAFTTSAASFIEGAGHSYGAGTNVVCVDAGSGAYKWDVLAGTIDLTELTEAEVQTIWNSI